MIDDARSNHVHVEVRHHVSTYYHGAVLFVESTYHSGQCIFIGIYVVAVQLYGKLAAFGVVYAHVPATADAEVVAFGDDMDEALVILILVDGFCRSVGGVVVDDDKIELEVCLLVQYGTDSIADGAYTVAYGDDNGCLVFEISGRELNLLELRFQVATDFFQMFRACRFHFNLTVTVLRVDVIEYLFAALTCIVFHFTVQIFIDMYEVCLLAQLQS